MLTSATSCRLHHAAVGRVDRKLLDRGEAVARLGRAPHLHVVGLAVPEDVADLLAGHEGGRRPPDVARLEPVALGLVELRP